MCVCRLGLASLLIGEERVVVVTLAIIIYDSPNSNAEFPRRRMNPCHAVPPVGACTDMHTIGGLTHLGADSTGPSVSQTTGGVCSPPADGSASALVQHAEVHELCRSNPPYGFRTLCKDRTSLSMLEQLGNPSTCRYKSCAIVGSGGTLLVQK